MVLSKFYKTKFLILTALQIGSTKTNLKNIEPLDTLLSKEVLDKSKYKKYIYY